MHLKVKQQIHVIDNHTTDHETKRSRAIPSVENTLKNINHNYSLFDELYTKLYIERSGVF